MNLLSNFGEILNVKSIYRVYPVMENLENSWNSISFSRPGKVMEFDSRFWKIHKKSWKLKDILFAKRRCSFLSSSILIQGYVYVIRSNFGIYHIFLYCDWNLVSGSQRQNRYMSLLCHEACKRSLILKLRSWKNLGKNIKI